ncbi:hypothetical protein C8A05DRAFT_35709 [Staphylotrichum tortipilum]|uniref:Uncharacterized protein n=1 Tax=Staphylotrichum tortipilum TaxID=2831512 RepID=A0AAN6MIB0_9PEZI|nr:hypothetical protein C8A05DRAFT_35709 [Staphylotrichum longicolle]
MFKLLPTALRFLAPTVLLLTLPPASAVDLATCKTTIQSLLANHTLSPTDPSIFHFNGTAYLSSPPSQIALTIPACRAHCPRPDFDLYSDMWPRLLTWLVPALLLIGNVHLPRVGRVNRALVVLHFLGDPIDSMWALLSKAEVWNRFFALALRGTAPGAEQKETARALAAVLSAFEELTGDMEAVEREAGALGRENGAGLSREELEYVLKETGEELVDSRSNEGLRTVLVIVNYLWAVLAALVPEIGGVQSSQPGGRIGTAMYISWLVTAVLLSNTISGFTSRRTCLRIMERYARTLKGRRRDLHLFPLSPRMLRMSKGRFEDFIDAQPWNGSVYNYRPRKRLLATGGKGDRSPGYLLALAATPILVAALSAFVIIWFTPTIGLGCRTLWVIGLTTGLLLSPVVTWAISRVFWGRTAWYLTIAKDTVVGLTIVFVIVLSSIGIFNTCWCWSGVYSRGLAGAYIDLDPQDERARNLHLLYPAMVGACLGLQLLVYVIMHRVMAPGGIVFRPREDEKMEQYRIIHGLGTPAMEKEMGRMGGGSRNREGSTSAAPLLLPPPAMSPHASPQASPMLRPQSMDSRASYPSGEEVGGYYFSSPDLRTSEHPLLGSPPDRGLGGRDNRGW